MKLIILDRDGVINYDSKEYIKSPEEWCPIPGSLAAIAQLKQAGYIIVLATNQSGIGRGLYDENMLHSIHEKMQAELKKLGAQVDKIFYCPHTPEDNCYCRKPKVGLFEQIAAAYEISLTNIPAIGDSLRDIQAAQSVGCKTILVRSGNGEALLKQHTPLPGVIVFNDLAAATKAILLQII